MTIEELSRVHAVQQALQAALCAQSAGPGDRYAQAAERVDAATPADLEQYLTDLASSVSDHGAPCVECGAPLPGLEPRPVCPECAEGAADHPDPRQAYGQWPL